MIAALISAVANATGLVIDKIILSRERVSLRVYLPVLFIFLFAFDAILMPFLGRVEWVLAGLPQSLFLMLLMVVIAIVWNVLYYQDIQEEKLHQHEMLMMLMPLMTVIMAALFFPEELEWRVFGLALVASITILWARTEKHHLTWDRAAYNMLLAVILMALENIIIRELLRVYSPVALYGIRTLIIGLFFAAYFRPRYRQVSNRHWKLLALSGLVGVTLMIARFYAFDKLGIVYTILLSVLAPVIAFYASWGILHERIRARVVAASLVIMACVVVATMFQFS